MCCSRTERASNQRLVSVPGGGISKAVYFPILLTEVGEVRLQVAAQAEQAADAVEQVLRVEPEGYRVQRNLPMALDLSAANGSALVRRLKLDFPADAVDGSRRQAFSVFSFTI